MVTVGQRGVYVWPVICSPAAPAVCMTPRRHTARVDSVSVMVGGGIAVGEDQVSASSGDDAAAVGQPETAGRDGRGGSQGLNGCEAGCDEELEFEVQACAVGESAQDRDG